MNQFSNFPGFQSVAWSLVDLGTWPDVLWSALVASGITLLGVLIVTLSNNLMLRAQLKHASREKDKERAATLRRDVFLPAAEELTKAMNFLSSLPKADLRKLNPVKGVQGFFAASAKLHLVADENTAAPVAEFSAAFGQLFMRVISQLMPLQKLQIDIEILDGLYERFQADDNRVLSERGRMVEAGDQDQSLFERLGRVFESHQEMASNYAGQRNEKWSDYNELLKQLSLFLIREMKPVAQLQIPLLVALRKDLGFETNADFYRKQLERQHQAMMTELDKIYKILDSPREKVD
jgi:hypothetical protein